MENEIGPNGGGDVNPDPQWHHFAELDDDDASADDIVSSFTVTIVMDVSPDHVPYFCESITRGITTNREKNATTLACYGVRRVPDPATHDDDDDNDDDDKKNEDLQNRLETNNRISCTSLRPNFIVKTVVTSREAFEASLNKKANQEQFFQHMSKNIFEAFPKFFSWNRYGEEYRVSCDPPMGDGSLYMMQSIKVTVSPDEEDNNRRRHREWATAAQRRRQGEDVVDDNNNNNGDLLPALPLHDQIAQLASTLLNVGKQSIMEECGDCLSYEVLTSNGPEHSNAVMVWASWTDVAAYLHHSKQEYVRDIHKICSENSSNITMETSFWAREEDGCITFDAAST